MNITCTSCLYEASAGADNAQTKTGMCTAIDLCCRNLNTTCGSQFPAIHHQHCYPRKNAPLQSPCCCFLAYMANLSPEKKMFLSSLENKNKRHVSAHICLHAHSNAARCLLPQTKHASLMAGVQSFRCCCCFRFTRRCNHRENKYIISRTVWCIRKSRLLYFLIHAPGHRLACSLCSLILHPAPSHALPSPPKQHCLPPGTLRSAILASDMNCSAALDMTARKASNVFFLPFHCPPVPGFTGLSCHQFRQAFCRRAATTDGVPNLDKRLGMPLIRQLAKSLEAEAWRPACKHKSCWIDAFSWSHSAPASFAAHESKRLCHRMFHTSAVVA